MRKLQDIVEFVSGSPQFRLTVSFEETVPVYHFYSQQNLEDDLTDIERSEEDSKTIRTSDKVNLVEEGDVLFSLISGRATIVRAAHRGYLYSQNYVKVTPSAGLDPAYLVYMLNESVHIRRQWQSSLQGSVVIKYTVKQLRELEVPELPSLEKQKTIGEIYLEQLRVRALKYRAADMECRIVLKKLRKM